MIYRKTISIVAVFAILFGSVLVHAKRNKNPRVLPIHSTPHGLTYGEWAGAWWTWAVGIPGAMNPILDTTGEFGDIDQGGSVWFLAGTFGVTAERTITVPPGKSLFFPLANSLWWAPDDLPTAEFVVEVFLGLDPDDFTDEELIALTAIWQVSFDELEMTCTVDGVALSDLEDYFAVSPGFPIADTDLLDDLGAPIAEDNLAVGAGYWVMLAPLSHGEHTIHFTVDTEHSFFGPFDLDVTYDITVE
jgi:hypothetical protein